MSEAVADYFVMKGSLGKDGMALYPFPDPSASDRWLKGSIFKKKPSVPVLVEIREGEERCWPADFYHDVPVMSERFYSALEATGVGNIDVYPAVLKSMDGSVELPGFCAYNILGLVSAADPLRTRYNPDNPSRLIDASIESLVVDPQRTHEFLLFRLAENVGTILVHGRVKRSLEAQNFTGLTFYEPSRLVIL
jgi:hypothetical protein